MSLSLDTNSPISYGDWLQYQDAINPEDAQSDYLAYLQTWYNNQKIKKQNVNLSLKDQYVQLAKDLSYLFAAEESLNPFLKNINYNSDEELIYAIPFFARKLKQIAVVLKNKRQSIKKSKLKYNLVGSNEGLENLLYDYVLKGFTNTENSITQVPASNLILYFPDLSAVKDNFFIEIEELHDTNSYFDSDPAVSIENYVDYKNINDLTPLDGLSDDDIDHLLATRFLSRIADTPLSNIFKAYLTSIPTISPSLSSNAYNLTYNQIYASRKYLGEPVYGLTAVRLKEINKPDIVFSLNLEQGNNWFYWPSGNFITNENIYNNDFSPITLNSSNLVNSNATAGTDYTNSDLIFTDKNGLVEGAWLRGPYYVKSNQTANITIQGSETRNFIYPFAGIQVESKTLKFLTYTFNDTNNSKIDSFAPQVKEQILKDYYTSDLPLLTANPIYLNQTELIKLGAYASEFSTEADNIIKLQKTNYLPSVYSESVNGTVDQAYLYKFLKTDLPINVGLNEIHWPINTYTTTDNNPVTITNDFCLDVKLSEINPTNTMIGSIAGTSFNNSDIIYKYSKKDGDPIEAAWLGSDSISNLDIGNNSISIYSSPAIKCAQPVEGSAQSSLSLLANGSDKISFVWMDQDTPADEVFKYIEHLPSCPYGKEMPHNLYEDQDYQNPNPINLTDVWNTCNCKSIHYSPIGHSGTVVSDYNGMADYLFADPDGVGVDFTLNGWTDTRNLGPTLSPQFSFYKISSGDKQVGFGGGSWKTGNGSKMILKTGKRYIYYRTSLRTQNSPYFVTNYKYKNVKGIYHSSESYNLAILLDLSRSQKNSLDTVKEVAKNIIKKLLINKSNVQISLVIFGSDASRVTYLSKDWQNLNLIIDNLKPYESPSQYQSNIADALDVANEVLKTTVKSGGNTSSISNLCNNLNYTILQGTINSVKIQNDPTQGTGKILEGKILIFSDGVETVSTGLALPNADVIRRSGVSIYGVDIGELSNTNNLITTVSTSFDYYFNLQHYLTSGDGDINTFSEYISLKLGGSYPITPTWYKAIRGSDGNWVGTRTISDMVLRAGDYIGYVHQQGSDYNSPINSNTNFNTSGLSFTINIKLNGWDYDTNTFGSSNIGKNYGAKPFWAKVYTSPDTNNNWNKGTTAFGGQVRFFNDYTPIHQPQISSLILSNGDNIKYVRKTNKNLVWKQPLTINTLVSSYQWNKLTFKKDFSNLADFLTINKYDGIVSDTNIPSDITLEGYSSFRPAYYNYYARKPFIYTENLYLLNKCLNSFVVYNTGAAIVPTEPYSHLDNVHYPTVATVSLPSQSVSNRQVGEYLLPEKLGTPFYRGKGYTIELDNDSLTYIDSISAERLYLDLEKYGPRNRGLTKKDQLTPTKITDISNYWFIEPYSSGSKSGVLTDTLENQKLTPYQSSYEIYGKNYYGLARQTDIFQFWTPAIDGVWNNSSQYPLDFKQELPRSQYVKRKQSLLVNKGDLTNWRTDLFGNEYGLYKKFSPNDIYGLKMWFSADYGVISLVSNNAFSPDEFSFDTLTSTNTSSNAVKWMDKSGRNNNLIVSKGSPKLIKDAYLNNNLTLYFDGSSNFYNDLNINTSNATMFVVGRYHNASTLNDYASSNFQVIAGFGKNSPEIDLNYINKGSLVFSQSFGNFSFEFGNNSGIITDDSVVYQMVLSGNSNYPATNSYYMFESIFNQPNIQTYINGNLFADTYGTINPSDSAKRINQNLYSLDGFWVGSYINNILITPCSIAEIIYYDKALTIQERINVENYLKSKYSL
jgi:hypothetical protein